MSFVKRKLVHFGILGLKGVSGVPVVACSCNRATFEARRIDSSGISQEIKLSNSSDSKL